MLQNHGSSAQQFLSILSNLILNSWNEKVSKTNFFKGLKFLEPVPVSANFENNKGNAENFFWWEATPTDYSNWVCNLPISNNLNS